MKQTNPLVHAVHMFAIAFAGINDNWFAAAGWAVAWLSFVSYDAFLVKTKMTMKTLELFVRAHKGKWPSREAEDAAAKELQEFVEGGKR